MKDCYQGSKCRIKHFSTTSITHIRHTLFKTHSNLHTSFPVGHGEEHNSSFQLFLSVWLCFSEAFTWLPIKHPKTKLNLSNNSALGTGPSLLQEMDYEQLFSDLEVNYLKSEQRLSTDLSRDCGPIVKHTIHTSKIKSQSMPWRVHSLTSTSDKGGTISHICRWEAGTKTSAWLCARL